MSRSQVQRYPIRRLLPGAGYRQVLAVLVAVLVIVLAPVTFKLIFGAMLAVGMFVRVFDGGYVELAKAYLTVRGYYFTRIPYVNIGTIEAFEPR